LQITQNTTQQWAHQVLVPEAAAEVEGEGVDFPPEEVVEAEEEEVSLLEAAGEAVLEAVEVAAEAGEEEAEVVAWEEARRW